MSTGTNNPHSRTASQLTRHWTPAAMYLPGMTQSVLHCSLPMMDPTKFCNVVASILCYLSRGREQTVSLDRLKPAYIDAALPNATPFTPASTTSPSTSPSSKATLTVTPATPSSAQRAPPRTTRSGRHVRWPQCLHDYIP